jgi:6-phosphogluconolactonase (cycloisomerase 2 family)
MGSVGNRKRWSVKRREFLKTTGAFAGFVGLAPALWAPFVSKVLAQTKTLTRDGGHLYTQTNETVNAVIHYLRSASGTITEVERIPPDASGSGVFKPIYEANGPNAFEGAGSVNLTPDRRFLFTTNGGVNSVSSLRVGEDGRLTLLDVKPTGNAVKGKSGTAKSLAYCPSKGTLYVLHSFGPDHVRLMSVNDERDPDGLVIFPVDGDGTLGAPSFHDAGSAAPFYIAFLHGRPNIFINGTAAGNGLVMSRIDADGRIGIGPLDTSAGKPSELCWVAISPDDRLVFVTNFGYSSISSYRIDGAEVSIAKDPASPKVPGDDTFRAINGIVSSGPSDNWITPDGAYLYQIYRNASKLVGYATQPDGSLNEITSVRIPTIARRAWRDSDSSGRLVWLAAGQDP